MSTSAVDGVPTDGTRRERVPPKPSSAETAKSTVQQLNKEESTKKDAEKKTYGRTPDGTGALTLLYMIPCSSFSSPNATNQAADSRACSLYRTSDP